jgi:hypothetical protein
MVLMTVMVVMVTVMTVTMTKLKWTNMHGGNGSDHGIVRFS